MILRKFIRPRILVTAAGIVLLFFGILFCSSSFATLVSQSVPDWYTNDFYGKDVLIKNAFMPGITELLREAGFLTLIGIAILIACILPVFFILNDYHTVKSIRTIMRLPTSKSLYYIDKLIPPLIILSVYWFMQFLSLREAANTYIKVIPEEIRPVQIKTEMWHEFPQSILYPFSDPSRVPAMISFLILIPATVILIIFATKSKHLGIFSFIIACAGVFAEILYFMEFPVSVWLTPFMATAVVFAGLLHVNKLPIV